MLPLSLRKLANKRSVCYGLRSISNFVEIKELPKHVTQDMIMNKVNEYGSVIGIKLFESFNKDNKKVISVKIHFKQLNAALSFMDELNRSVLFGNRVDLSYFYPPPQYFKARLYGISPSDGLANNNYKAMPRPI